jgi:1L-myo-inositol 1-phosphate cytidylyltransferase / CDP-L-myo-inositol myo-inositolphosphotransferase
MVAVAVIIGQGGGGALPPLTQLGGLSLLKRAVLTAQKAGAQMCYLCFDQTQTDLVSELQHDPRVTCQLVWSASVPIAVAPFDTSEECLVFPIDTIFRHPTIHELTRHSRGRAVVVTDSTQVPALALLPTSALPLMLTELQSDTRWNETSPLSQAPQIYPPSGPNVFLRRLTTTTPIETVEQELLLSLENPRDGQVDTYLNRKISRPITRWLVRTPLTPNHVTLLSCAVGIFGALCFVPGGYWGPVLGALLLQFSVVLDCCDGEIARVKFMESALGDWLDIVCDTVVSIAIFLGIGLAVWHNGTSQHALALAGLLALGGALAFPFVTLAEKTEAAAETHKSWENHTIQKLLSSLTTRDFSVVVGASAIAGQLSWFLWGAALGAHVFWLSLAWLLHRAGRLRDVRRLWKNEKT